MILHLKCSFYVNVPKVTVVMHASLLLYEVLYDMITV